MPAKITTGTHYTECHELSSFHSLTITLERTNSEMWQGAVYLHLTGKVPTSGLHLYSCTLPAHEQLNDVLMQVRARLEHKFELLSTTVTESMRGADNA